MTKEVNLETKSSDKSKNDPLETKFVDPPDEKSEFPPIGFFSLFRYCEAIDKFSIFVGILCCIGTAVCQPLNMLVFGNLTGDLIDFAQGFATAASNDAKESVKEKLADDMISFVIYNTGLGVAMLVLTYFSSFVFNYSGIRQSFKIRKLYLEKVLNQDVSWYDLNTTGDFASRMADDLVKLEDGLGEKISMFLHFQMSFAACLIMALIKGWELALICLISLPVTMTAMGLIAYLTSRLAKNEMEAYGTAGAIAEEVFSTVRTVLAFGGEKKEIDRYKNELVTAKNNNILRGLLSGIGFGILWLGIYSSYALAFWYGVGLVIDEKNLPESEQTYSPRNMVTVFFSIMTGSMNFGLSSPYIEVFGVAKGAATKIYGVIDNVPVINKSKHTGLKPDKVIGDIVFQDVHFKYPSRKEIKILDGLNLSIKQGETIALVGSSGCGKSTCIQLLQRFYDPHLGKVTLDGNDLKDLNLVWLRNNIGVVGQEPVLFGTTIAENIRYGFMEATQEQIEQAARKANAHKFISMLPQGYNTMVGERGAQLSGGQKQRIAIARALVREPAILLLDEATSALDTNSEAKVQAALDNASKECTTIIIAHRLSTIRGANRIIVIDKGVVVEEGNHQELMDKQGDYYNLVMAQVSPTEDEALEKRVSVVAQIDEDEPNPRTFQTQMSVHYDDQSVSAETVSFKRILGLSSNEWVQNSIGVVASVFMGFGMPIFSVLFGDIISILQYDDEEYVRSETNMYCIYFLCAGVMAGLSTFLQIYTFGYAGENLVMRVRGRMFETMLKQEIGWYDRKENGVGALCAKLSSEASNIQGATGQRIGTIFQSLATLCLSVGLSMYFEYRLGLVAMAFTPVILIAVFFQHRTMQNEIAGFRDALESSTKLAVEAVGNVRTVISLGCENNFHKLYVKDLVPYLSHARKNIYIRAFVYGFSRSIMFFAFSVCNYYGGYLIRNDGMPFEKLLKVSQAMIMGTATIASALAFAPNFQRGLESAAKVLKLFDRIPEIRDSHNCTNATWKTGDIEYLKVHFKYPTRPNTSVLNGLDLSIINGKTVALVGPSGCGKSTIIQLIERYYDPLNGMVSIDNQDIRGIAMEDLRSHLGIVSQEPNLFDRTIAENIAYGDNSRNIPRAEIVDAAKNANIHKFITSLPLGYDTPLGDKGTQLSGGQKQRVAIARALVRNPKVLLLDEATSALDTESEKIVQEALDNAKQGRTCITIAHRLSTIQDADVICVIQDGKVLEIGKHAELLQKKGLYYTLHKLQVRKK